MEISIIIQALALLFQVGLYIEINKNNIDIGHVSPEAMKEALE